MTQTKQIGIVFCDPPSGHMPVDLTDLIIHVRDEHKIPVIIEHTRYLFSDHNVLQETVRHHHLEYIILAGIQPARFANMARSAMAEAGKAKDCVYIADFGDEWTIYESARERAKRMIDQVLAEIENRKELEGAIHPDTLIIGAGIAGIQAALELANSGQQVYLLEKTATIGGHMAMFDKTFPTLDCAACILTPKMVEVGQHRNIEMITYADLVGLEGSPGSFTAIIHKRARRVNLKTCIGCGSCAEVCPSKVKSEFDQGTTLRKAIYIPFPQAVPNKYVIDPDTCRYVQDGKCKACIRACPVENCINLDEKDVDIRIEVGNIIVATGFRPFDAAKIERFGYGRFPNVLTSLEFERLINAAGPTGGKITFRSQDKKGHWIFEKESGEPKSVALIHCIGSRDEQHHPYCSKVCCMYTLKLAHLVREKLPDARVFEYFIDMRAYGKGYEEFYNRIENEGINIIRGKAAQIKSVGDQLVLRAEDIVKGRMMEQDFDMVVLSVGLEPTDEQDKISQILGLEIDDNGWYVERNEIAEPIDSIRPGIRLAGVCQGPKDIPDSVAQASAAAAGVLQSIMAGRFGFEDDNSHTINNLEVRL